MLIEAYVNKNNQVTIDPSIKLKLEDITDYIIHFNFIEKPPDDLTYYLVVKTVFDTGQTKVLDATFQTNLPEVTVTCFDKLGIGIQGVTYENDLPVIKYDTELCYLQVLKPQRLCPSKDDSGKVNTRLDLYPEVTKPNLNDRLYIESNNKPSYVTVETIKGLSSTIWKTDDINKLNEEQFTQHDYILLEDNK